MSENPKRHRVRKEPKPDEPSQKMRIRVKKPRPVDENGVPLPHKHEHTHSSRTGGDDTRFTYAEVSVVPMESQDLTAFDAPSIQENNSFVTPSVSRISVGSGNPAPKTHKKKLSPAQLNIFEDLEPEFNETKIKKGSRFIKHDSDDDFQAFTVSRDINSTILDTNNGTNSMTLSDTQELLKEQSCIDFEDAIDDPFFAEIQRELVKDRENKLAKIKDDTMDQYTIVGQPIEEHVVVVEDIYPGDLYPRSTCPMKWRRDSVFSPISEPPPRQDDGWDNFTEIEVLVEANPESADYAEADTQDGDAQVFIETTMTAANTEDESSSLSLPKPSVTDQRPAPPLKMKPNSSDDSDDESNDSAKGNHSGDDGGSGDDDDDDSGYDDDDDTGYDDDDDKPKSD